jgi:predicted ATPase/DNA-binding SARP family transcriptional activator
MTEMLRDDHTHATGDLLHVTLFGPPRLAWRDAAVVLPRRQMRALVFCLAAAAQPLSRDRLCFLLWPDSGESVARRNLSVLLNQLRTSLPSSDLLVVQREAVTLLHERLWSDAAQLDAALREAHRHDNIEPLAAAVTLYGGPFLHGFTLPSSTEFDEWVEQERHTWERRYLDALATLVDGYARRDDYAEAIETAHQALTVDELAEETHRRLIELYAATGDRTAALRQFDQCATALDRELGISPLPETIALADAVREGRMERRVPRAALHLAAPVEPPEASLLSADAHVTLPAVTTPLLGRQDEMTRVLALLHTPTLRLVTLCGPGGSGKTRLVLEAAWQCQTHGDKRVIFVALATVRDAALVLTAIARACGLKQTDLAAVADHLRGTRALLVLDNCEHLPDAATDIAALLASTPDLRVLATSRTPLRVHGEHVFPVPPLPTPDLAHLPPLPALAGVPSVALLVARTEALNPAFALRMDNARDLAEICVRLDGLPLAIELAAARLRMLTPNNVLRRLDRRLTLLTGGTRDLPDRQRTLHATIDWSYRLLSLAEQRCFERCSVFVGGWTLDALHAIENTLDEQHPRRDDADLLDTLAALVDQSLVQAQHMADGATRFTMLETIREFAANRLHEHGLIDVVAQAHATYFVTFIERMEANGVGQNTPQWVANIERDHDNLRAALRWLLDHDSVEQAIQLGSVLQNYWYWREGEREGRQWLREIVDRSTHIHTLDRARIVYKLGLLAQSLGENDEAVVAHETAYAMCETLPLATLHGSVRGALGILACRSGDYERAVTLLEESLAIMTQVGTRRFVGNMSANLAGVLADQAQDFPRAIALYEQAWQIAREHGLLMQQSTALCGMGLAYAITGNMLRASETLNEALRIQQSLDARGAIAWTLQYLGMVAYIEQDDERAQRLFLESLEIAAETDGLNTVPLSVEWLAGIAARQRQPVRAARMLGGADAVRETIHIVVPPLERPYYDSIVAAVRAQLPAATFDALWQAGRRLPLDHLIALALEDHNGGEAQNDTEAQSDSSIGVA